MKSFLFVVVMSAGVLVAGCSGEGPTDAEPRLDLAGTQQDFDRSQEQVRESLAEERREIFNEAMRILYFNASALRDAGTLSDRQAEALLMEQMHESTAGQIVDEALRTYREFCTDNQISEEECNNSIEAAGLDTW